MSRRSDSRPSSSRLLLRLIVSVAYLLKPTRTSKRRV
ncbi:unnamed protein product [Arabidopsis halleri]